MWPVLYAHTWCICIIYPATGVHLGQSLPTYLASDWVHFEFLEEGQDGLQVIHIAMRVNVGVLEGLQGECTVGEGQPPELSFGTSVGGGFVPAIQCWPLSTGQVPVGEGGEGYLVNHWGSGCLTYICVVCFIIRGGHSLIFCSSSNCNSATFDGHSTSR